MLSFLFLGETCCTQTEKSYFWMLNRNFHDASPCVSDWHCYILINSVYVCVYAGTACLLFMIYLMFTSLWLIPTLYFSWQIYDWHTPERGQPITKTHIYILNSYKLLHAQTHGWLSFTHSHVLQTCLVSIAFQDSSKFLFFLTDKNKVRFEKTWGWENDQRCIHLNSQADLKIRFLKQLSVSDRIKNILSKC